MLGLDDFCRFLMASYDLVSFYLSLVSILSGSLVKSPWRLEARISFLVFSYLILFISISICFSMFY